MRSYHRITRVRQITLLLLIICYISFPADVSLVLKDSDTDSEKPQFVDPAFCIRWPEKDVINSNVHRNERNLVTSGCRKSLLWNRLFSKPTNLKYAFAHHYSNTKMNFLKRFSKFLSDI